MNAICLLFRYRLKIIDFLTFIEENYEEKAAADLLGKAVRLNPAFDIFQAEFAKNVCRN